MIDELLLSVKYLAGFYGLYYLALPLVRICYNYFIAVSFFSGRKDLKKHGSWAVVTGATDGIGKAYAHELAKDGFNMVLISRTESKLKDEAHAIEKSYNVSTKICAVDFTKTDIYETIKAELKGLDIGVLVNNVGISYAHPIYIYDEEVLSDELLTGLINCNSVSVVRMIRLVMTGMIARGNGGAIINVSSFSGEFPVPFLAVYSATKSFVDFLSRGINVEVSERHNIEVQSVLPLFVATKMSRMRPSFFSPSPTSYVRTALNMIRIESRTYGCLSHALQAFVMGLMPNYIRAWYLESVMKGTMHRAIKKKLKSK